MPAARSDLLSTVRNSIPPDPGFCRLVGYGRAHTHPGTGRMGVLRPSLRPDRGDRKFPFRCSHPRGAPADINEKGRATDDLTSGAGARS